MARITPDETLLGLLAAQPQHGYQLLEAFRDKAQLGQIWKLSTSQLYAVLKRLQRQGLTVGRQVFPEDAPARTEYALTGAGRARLQAWLHQACPSASLRQIRVEFLSRLYIARLLGVPIEPIVECQRAACRERLTELRIARQRIGPGTGYLALELLILQLEATIHWLEHCATMLTRTGEP